MNGFFSTLKGIKDLKQAAAVMKSAVAIIVTLMVAAGIVLNTYSENMGRQLSSSLFRLHVIANSDSPGDQSLKRDVRDAVLVFMHEKLAASKDIANTKSIIENNLEEIKSIARDVILKQGMNFNVKTTLGIYPFPTKSYGDITLPAGNYQALRLVIGNGEGANWWCVVFPPLCFVDVTHGTVPDSVKKDLKDALTDEEYDILTSADEESDLPIKIKFKIVELFQDSKLKVTSTLNKILKTPG